MNALKKQRQKANSFSPSHHYINWDTPELHWKPSDDEKWSPLSTSSSPLFDDWNPSNPTTYASTFQQHNLKVTKLSTVPDPSPPSPTTCNNNLNDSSFVNINDNPQTDMGANTNITNNLSLLHNVVWIKPLPIHSAKKEATISVSAIG